jgi:hypothetical protein
LDNRIGSAGQEREREMDVGAAARKARLVREQQPPGTRIGSAAPLACSGSDGWEAALPHESTSLVCPVSPSAAGARAVVACAANVAFTWD